MQWIWLDLPEIEGFFTFIYFHLLTLSRSIFFQTKYFSNPSDGTLVYILKTRFLGFMMIRHNFGSVKIFRRGSQIVHTKENLANLGFPLGFGIGGRSSHIHQIHKIFSFRQSVLAAQEELEAPLWICFTLMYVFSIFMKNIFIFFVDFFWLGKFSIEKILLSSEICSSKFSHFFDGKFPTKKTKK